MNKILINVMQQFSSGCSRSCCMQCFAVCIYPLARRELWFAAAAALIYIQNGEVGCRSCLTGAVRPTCWGSWGLHAMSALCLLKTGKTEKEGHRAGVFHLLFAAKAVRLLW